MSAIGATRARGVAEERKAAWSRYEVAEGDWRAAWDEYRNHPCRATLSGVLLSTAAMYRARLEVGDAVVQGGGA